MCRRIREGFGILTSQHLVTCIMVLNQDLQDFEDFYQLGVGWDGARCTSKCKINYPLFHFAAAMIAAAKYLDRDTFPISTILNQRRYQ